MELDRRVRRRVHKLRAAPCAARGARRLRGRDVRVVLGRREAAGLLARAGAQYCFGALKPGH